MNLSLEEALDKIFALVPNEDKIKHPNIENILALAKCEIGQYDIVTKYVDFESYKNSNNKTFYTIKLKDNDAVSDTDGNKMAELYTKYDKIRNLIDDADDEPILSNAEYDYLEGIIKPFRSQVMYITKKYYGADKCYISICIQNNNAINLPVFCRLLMYYKNMKGDKDYSLEELKL